MSIKVHLYSSLQSYTGGQNVVEVNGDTVGNCLGDLTGKYPGIKKILFDEQGNLSDQIFVSINLESAYRAKSDEPVKDGDTLYIVLVIAGG